MYAAHFVVLVVAAGVVAGQKIRQKQNSVFCAKTVEICMLPILLFLLLLLVLLLDRKFGRSKIVYFVPKLSKFVCCPFCCSCSSVAAVAAAGVVAGGGGVGGGAAAAGECFYFGFMRS